MSILHTGSPLAEVTVAVDDLNRSFGEFKHLNDRRLNEIERKGSADVLTVEAVERLNGKLTQYQDRVEQLTLSRKRTPASLERGSVMVDSEHKTAFSGYLRKGVEQSLQAFESKAMSTQSEADGGYSVPAQLADFMIHTIFDTSPIRQVANVVNIGNDAFEVLVSAADTEASWVTEAQVRNETMSPTLNKIRIPVQEMSAAPRASQRLLDDSSFNIEEYLAGEIADKFARLENTAFVNGSGVNQPRGFLTYSNGTAWGQIEQVKTGVNGAWAASAPADSLLDLMARLKSSYLNESVWLMNRTLLADIRKFKDSTGQYIWQPGLGATPTSLLGYPVYLAEDMPSKATGNLSVAFGNFKRGYMVVDRVGIRLLRDPYSAKPFVIFYTTKRTGGDVVNFEAIKLLQFAA
ncbi:MAG: phage major capsid protein [Alphaproteobacteria bacterium]|nr:phage major capsid protein [Alphaproteobacteria bacterium]